MQDPGRLRGVGRAEMDGFIEQSRGAIARWPGKVGVVVRIEAEV